MKWQPMSTAPRDQSEIIASDLDSIDFIWWDPNERCWRNRDCDYFFPFAWIPMPDHPPETLNEQSEAASSVKNDLGAGSALATEQTRPKEIVRSDEYREFQKQQARALADRLYPITPLSIKVSTMSETSFRALCEKVIAYNEGIGEYNFSGLSPYDRDNAAFDAWQKIKAELKSALLKPEVDDEPAGEAGRLAKELKHFLAGYKQMLELDPEHIYSIHSGHEMEAHLTVSQLSRIAKLLLQYENLVQEVWDLVGESHGVIGLHLNGDAAPWDELLPGGRFEYLTSMPVLSENAK